MNFIKKQPPTRLIALGFAFVILLGSILLIMPFSVRDNVKLSYIDSLYTSTSAVCVTGLLCVDIYDTFTPTGQFIVAALIQIGGLGVTAVGAGIILALGKKVDLKSRTLVRESMNLSSGKGIIHFLRDIFITTFIFEVAGAILSFIVFIKDYPPQRAIGMSFFHSIAAFNNSGFDIIGGFQNLIPYQSNILLNLVTCTLIFFGGIGFLVIKELFIYRFRWKKLSMHSKVVISVSLVLTVVGTLLIYATENIPLLGAFFASITTRTAGFSTYSYGAFTNAGIIVMILLMFIGASPGSTGGGIKTSTFFVLLQGIKSSATNKSEKAFHYSIPKDAFRKAAVISTLAVSIIIISTYILCITDPAVSIRDALFEMVSAFSTVGLSTGISPSLSVGGKVVSLLIMYIGRLGPLTIASMWYFSRGERVSYPQGNISIG